MKPNQYAYEAHIAMCCKMLSHLLQYVHVCVCTVCLTILLQFHWLKTSQHASCRLSSFSMMVPLLAHWLTAA